MAIPEHSDLIPIEIPEPEWGLNRLAHKAELMLLRFGLRVIETVRIPFIEVRETALRLLFENTAEQIKPIVIPFLERIEEMPHIPQEVKDAISELKTTEPITLTAVALFVFWAILGGILSGVMGPFQRYASQEMDNLVRSARLSAPDAFAAYKRGALDYAGFLDNLKDNGWPDHLIEAWQEILKPLISVDDWGELYTRKEITEATFTAELAKRAFTAEQINEVKVLLRLIPPVNDIIRMAVREAFNPEIVAEFQLEAELPGEFVTWADRKGLDELWTRAYWASHWQLPSLTMGFEMLHRRIITPDQMEMLIKAQDISPFWRDKLIDLSYRPYTRVDVRRMHSSGILTEDDVYDAYRDIGYNDERARNMTDFTIAYNAGAERDLTKSEILYGRKVGFFSYEEFNALLADIGYDQNEIEYYEARLQYDLWKALVKETVAYVKKMYVANQMTEAEVYQALGDLNLPSEQMNRYIRQWDIDKKRKTARPTKTDLVKFLGIDVITEDEFTTEMSGWGYGQKYIQWFIDSLGTTEES